MRNWGRNARGEWYVVAQAVLLSTVLAAPILDGQPGDILGVPSTVLGGALVVAGVAFILAGSVALGRKNLSPFPAPKDTSTLVESGIFSIVRHPIYFGLSLGALGWSVAWRSIAALVATLLLLVFFDGKAGREERWLEEKFPRYAVYKGRVKKLIPFVY